MGHTYRHAIKATAVLSSAQVVEALMSIIRAKVIAVILGPVGIALNSIFQTTITTLQQFTSMGLMQSGVRDISKAYQEGNRNKLQLTVAMFLKIVCPLALLSLIICIVGAPLLSKLSFGKNDDHTIDFLILSIGSAAILLSYANITILQGTQRLTYLAKTTIFAAVISLAVSLPFYFFLGNRGVACAISCGYVITLLINTFYVKKLGLQKVKIKTSKAWHLCAPMIKLGVVIMISSLIINVFTYMTNVLIRYFGSLEDVGLYQAGYSLTSRNFAILSAALAADYFPRLSGLLDNREEFNKTVSEQSEILLITISYIAMFLIVFADLIIKIMLSSKFLVIAMLVKLIAFSFVFHVMWLALSYIALAKGDKKIYLVYDAIIGNGCYFTMNIIAYTFWGINGLGMSTIIGSIFVSLLLLFVYGKKYDFSYTRGFWNIQLASICFLSLFMALELVKQINMITYTILCTIAGVIYSAYTYKALDKRIQINSLIKRKLKLRK